MPNIDLIARVLRNPLVYPAGNAAGFDPNHIASGNIRFSGIASGSTFYSLLSGIVGARTGTIAGIDSRIGPIATFHDGASDNIAFTGTAQTRPASATMAAIFTTQTSVNFNGIFSAGPNSTWTLGNRGVATGIEFYNGNTEAVSSLLPVAGVPYLVIASSNGTTVNYVLKRLDTGGVLTASVAGSASAGAEGNYTVGNFNNASDSIFGSIAAVMYAASYMPLTQMLLWAQDPWSFWYPRRISDFQFLVGSSTVAVTLGGTAKLFAPQLGPQFQFQPQLAFPPSAVQVVIVTPSGSLLPMMGVG